MADVAPDIVLFANVLFEFVRRIASPEELEIVLLVKTLFMPDATLAVIVVAVVVLITFPMYRLLEDAVAWRLMSSATPAPPLIVLLVMLLFEERCTLNAALPPLPSPPPRAVRFTKLLNVALSIKTAYHACVGDEYPNSRRYR